MEFKRNYGIEELPIILLCLFFSLKLEYYLLIILIILFLIVEFTYFEIKESIRLENENIIIVKTFLFKKERYYFNYKDFEIKNIEFSKTSIDRFLGFDYYFSIKSDNQEIKIFRLFLGNDEIFFNKNKQMFFLKNLEDKKKLGVIKDTSIIKTDINSTIWNL